MNQSYKQFVCVTALVLSACAFAQFQEDWIAGRGRYSGSAHGEDHALDVKTSAHGEAHVCGYAKEDNGGDSDAVVAKYSADGTELWHRGYNGSANLADAANRLVLGHDGSVYIVGYTATGGFHGSYFTKLLAAKFDRDGDLKWAYVYDNPDGKESEGRDIVLRESDGEVHLYVTGYVRSDGQGLSSDILTIKIKDNGDSGTAVTGWPQIFDFATEDDEGIGLDVDPGNHVVVAGFGHQTGANQGNEWIVLRYDGGGGAPIWSRTYHGSNQAFAKDDRPADIQVDARSAIFVTGFVTNKETNDSIHKNYATARWDADGTRIWDSQYDGVGEYRDDAANALSIQTDISGNALFIYITGWSMNSNGNSDYATLKLAENSGAAVWTALPTQAARYDRSAGDDVATSIEVAGNGNSYICGFAGTAGSHVYDTLRYDRNGAQRAELPFSTTGENEGNRVSVSCCGHAHVTGFSPGDFADDYLTREYSQPAATYSPLLTSMTLERGVVLGGNIGSLQTLDADRLYVKLGTVFSNSEYPIRIVVQTALAGGNPTELCLTVVSQANNTNINQVVEFWDVTAGQWAKMDERLCKHNADETLHVRVPTYDPSRFVLPGESPNLVQARLKYKPTGAVFSFPWTVKINYVRFEQLIN